MKILIYGVGGIGGFLGSKLFDKSIELTFLARGNRFEFLKKNGLVVKTGKGNSFIKKINVVNFIDPSWKFDFIFSTVKLYDFDDSLNEILLLKNKDFLFIPFQNGIYAEKKASDILGKEKVCAGVAQISSYIDNDQNIRHVGDLATFFVGSSEPDNKKKLKNLCLSNLNKNLDLRYKDNIYEKIWQKFIFLSAYSGMTTAYNKTIGQIFKSDTLKSEFIDAMQETFNLANLYKIQFKQNPLDFWIERIKSMPFEMTSSMHEDYKKKKKLELKWLSGSVVSQSLEVGIDCKVHKKIISIINN